MTGDSHALAEKLVDLLGSPERQKEMALQNFSAALRMTMPSVISETSSGVTRSFSQYGEHGHAERVAAFGMTELRAFDAVGNLLRGSDGDAPVAGGVELRAFDADRNLAAVTLQPSGAGFSPLTIQLEHRSDGKTTRVLRGGDDHELVYDAFGRLSEQRERVGGVWQITRLGHDAAGRPTFVERPNGMREEVSYGPADHVAGVRRLRRGALESTLTLGYQDGALVRVDDSASGVERYAYDTAGRVVATTFAGGERLLTGYDLRSRVRAESFVGTSGGALATLLYDHDLADRRVRVADAGGALQLTSFSDGRLAEQRTGNGLVRTFSYRADGLFTGATTRNAGGALVEQTTLDHQLEVDDAGVVRIRQRATTMTSGGVDVITVEDYELAPVPAAGSSPPGARIVSWSDGLTGPEADAFDDRRVVLVRGQEFVSDLKGRLETDRSLFPGQHHASDIGALSGGRIETRNAVFRSLCHPAHDRNSDRIVSRSTPRNGRHRQIVWPYDGRLVRRSRRTGHQADCPQSNRAGGLQPGPRFSLFS
jgi:YD repeat-containing protein